jgi:hypothetical protein
MWLDLFIKLLTIKFKKKAEKKNKLVSKITKKSCNIKKIMQTKRDVGMRL